MFQFGRVSFVGKKDAGGEGGGNVFLFCMLSSHAGQRAAPSPSEVFLQKV
jgi:hypothetical protein